MLDGLMGVKNEKGTIVFVCGKCRSFPEHAYAHRTRDNSRTSCYVASAVESSGNGSTIEAPDNQLREFAKKVQLLVIPEGSR